MKIPFSPPDIGEEEIREVCDTLRSGWITTGPKTKQFEKEITAFTGADGCACFGSQTAAAETALRLLGIGEGDEVITSVYTYTATASVICHVGATPVLLDTAKDSFFMDPQTIADAITERTKAVIPVDLGGVPCDYDAIYQAVQSKQSCFRPSNPLQEALGRVAVVADGAHSFGGERNGVKSGALADFTNFSFHAVKNLTTGEGGACTWRAIPGVDNGDIYRQMMLLSLHGQSKDALAKTQLGSWEYDIVAPYYKCNMTDIMASLGLAQLRRYPSLLARRQEIIAHYEEGLSPLPVTFLRHNGEGYRSSGHLFLTRVDGADVRRRNAIIQTMAQAGVATNVHYKPLPLHTGYQALGFSMEHYPHAMAMYENEITLPLHTLLTDEMVDVVISTYREALRG